MAGNENSGRKTKFSPEMVSMAVSLAARGLTEELIADELGICVATLRNWKNRETIFLAALKGAKELVDSAVESALLNRALGYTAPEVKVFCDTKTGEIHTAEIAKHYPPDVTAQIFWLKNRRPDKWRDRHIDPDPPSQDAPKELMTFEEFCVNAGYPPPYPKQIEMAEFGIDLEATSPRLLLGARSYGKTDYVTILGAAYEIYRNPTGPRFLLLTDSRERNTTIVKEVEAACEKAGVVFEVKNTSNLRTPGTKGKDNNFSALTINSSSRGRHPDMILMDDPVTPEDTGEAKRKRVKKCYDEAYKLCKNILIIGQPVHKFDLYQELRPKLTKMEVPYGSIPELDCDIEAQRLAGVDEASIQASYFLNVTSESATPFEKIRYIPKFPTGENAVAYIDPSFTGGDYTAMSIFKGYMEGVAVVGFVRKKAWNHCIEDLAKEMKKYNVRRLAFETNSLGDMPLDILRPALAPYGITVIGLNNTTNKHSDIMAAGTFAHMIHLSKESDPTYVKHVVQYEYKAEFDDAPDSLARGLKWLGLIRGKK